jgi:hypothetical protein
MTQLGIPELDLRAPFNEAFRQIGHGVDQCVDRFNEIVENVRTWFWTVPPPVLLWVRERLRVCRDMVETVIERARYALDHQVPVLTLITASFDWLLHVRQPVSDIAAGVERTSDEKFRTWSGDAARSYWAKAGMQRAAAEEVVGKADFMSAWLFGIAQANVDYAVELARVVTQFVARLTEAVIEVGSVVGIPWALESLSEALGELVRAGLDNLFGIAERFVDAIGNVRDVYAQLTDHSKLPGGRWPGAVID